MSARMLLLVLVCVTRDAVNASSGVKLSGPGMEPQQVVLPCRYLWVAQQSNNNTEPKADVSGTISSMKRDTPLRSELLNMEEDGLFLLRYQTRSTLDNLKISVNDEDLIDVKNIVQPHGCRCSRPNFNNWLEDFGCQDSDQQIDADFEPFDEIDIDKALEEAVKRFATHPGSHSFCHYSIVDSEIYRRCYGEHVGFKMFPDSTFSLLAKMVKLPDVEFLINLGDWPLIDKDEDYLIPMLSWCKTDSKADILLPTYELTEATTECMGRQVMDMLSVQGNANTKWEDRQEKAFFKGRDSSRARLKLARMMKDNTIFFEGGITRYFFFRDEEKDIGSVPHSSFFDFFKYKYQISMDGTVAAYRFPFLMAGGSLIFKQESPYYEHFYKKLEPWVHYVPVKKDISDLMDQLEWALKHDEEAKQIAKNARDFARENLMPREVLCYHALVLKKWHSLMKSKVKIRKGMEKVENKHLDYFDCNCNANHIKDEL